MSWQEIVVNSKILGHISAGVYRSAGGALKELVSNAFDADAQRVVITTNHPSFDIITCYDNGTGMTLTQFQELMKGGIGDSSKRTSKDIPSKFNRPKIGRLGIGMLGIAQVCHEFKIISHHAESNTAFQAVIKLVDFLREKIDSMNPDEIEGYDLEVGQFQIDSIDYDESKAGTYIIATDMRSAFVRKFRESAGKPLPLDFSTFLKDIHKKRSIKELGDYWQMVFELALLCPLPYTNEDPFTWKRVRASDLIKSKIKELGNKINNYKFEVVVDGLLLRKPNQYPYPQKRTDRTLMTGRVFFIDEDLMVHNRRLKLQGYMYVQDGQAIEPLELRGLLIRIRDVAIGTYDQTFLNYPKLEGPRFNWVSSEIYVQEGLEHALNIDRDSFNQMHPHYVKVQQIVHRLLKEVFSEASKGTSERSQKKHESTLKTKQLAIGNLLRSEFGTKFEVKETEDSEYPLTIDPEKKRVLVNPDSVLLPKSKAKKEAAQLVAYAFELSLLEAPLKRRKKFYELLTQLLNL